MSSKDYNPEDQVAFTNLKLTVHSLLRLFFRFLSFLQLVIQKGRLLMLGGLVLGGLLGASYYFQKTQYYEGSMLVHFNKLTKKAYADIVAQLNHLASSGAHEELAKELNVSPQVVAQLNYIDAVSLSDTPLSQDTSSKTNQQFKIVINLKTADSIGQLQNSLIDFLNNRPYLKLLREKEKKIFADKLASLQGDLAKMDSLKLEVNHFLATSKISANYYNNAINPADVYEQSIAMLKERESTERALNLEDHTVVLLDGFKVGIIPRSVSLMESMVFSAIIGIVVAFIITFLIQTRKKIMS